MPPLNALSPATVPAAAPRTSNARRVIGGSAWVLAGRLLFGAAVLLQNVVLARLLGPQDLGSFILVQSIILPAAIFAAFGLDLLAVRELRDPRDAENRVSPVSFLARGTALIAVAASVVSLALAAVLTAACGVAASMECGLATTGPAVLWPLIALSAFQLLAGAVLRALGRMGAASFLTGVLSTTLLLCAIGLAYALRLDLGLWDVLVMQILALAAAAALSVLFLRGIDAIGRGGPASLAQLARSGPALMTTQVLALLVSQSDVWVLGAVVPPEAVAQYGLAARLAQFVSLPHIVLGGVLPPLMSWHLSEGRHREIEGLVRASTAAAAAPSVLLGAVFVLLGGGILEVAFGPFYRAAALTLAILAVGNVVNVACGPCSQLLIMSGHQRALNRITCSNCFFCLGCGTAAALHFGAVGVASVYAAGLCMQGFAGAFAASKLAGVKTHAGPLALARAIRARLGGTA